MKHIVAVVALFVGVVVRYLRWPAVVAAGIYQLVSGRMGVGAVLTSGIGFLVCSWVVLVVLKAIPLLLDREAIEASLARQGM